MFGDDARGDGEAQAGAAILGRKVRQEETIFVLRRDAVAGVLHADFDDLRIAMRASGNHDLADRRSFQRFGGVVDQVDDHAAQEPAVGADGRQILGERRLQRDAIESPGENLDGFVHDGVGAGGRELGDREAHELRKFIDQGGKSGNLALDQAGALLDEPRKLGIARRGDVGRLAALEEARQALRRKLNGRERILDLVSDAPGDFLPRGGFSAREAFR